MIELPETTSSKIAAALLSARRAAGSPTMGMVLTFLSSTSVESADEVLTAALAAAREHPCRILLVITGHSDRSTLDAEVRVGDGAPGEVVIIRTTGRHAEHPGSIVRPLLLPDSPVVVFWPGQPPPKPQQDELGQLANRRITNAAATAQPSATLRLLASNYAPGDTDLSWTRITPWRSLIAAALDQFPTTVSAARVEAEPASSAADLLASWLRYRLEIPVVRADSAAGAGITAVTLTTAQGDIAIVRPQGATATYQVPNQPDRMVALPRRDMAELITEELRQMGSDPIYAETLQAFAAGDLDERRTDVS